MNPVTEPIQNFKARLLNNFQTFENDLNGKGNSTLHEVRQDAIRQFDTLGLPTTRHEEWKYTNITPIAKQEFDFQATSGLSNEEVTDFTIPGLDAHRVVFVNGVYNASLSSPVSEADGILVENFTEAYERQPELLLTSFARVALYQKDAFTALSTAFARHGAFIHVPDHKVIEKPIVLHFISDSRTSNPGSHPRNLFVAGKNSQVKVIELFQTIGDQPSFTNIVTEVVLDENAYVEYYKIQNESENAYHIGTTQVNQFKSSHFYATTISVNGGFIRNNLNIVLNGEHCEANMFGLYIPTGKQLVDNHTVVDHAKPNSYSNELYKGILNDRATGVFNGKIFVRQDAQKTNAFQSNRNIVLSNEASMNTKPQLEIFADDVKCSHGSTTGQLNDEALFYLRSRGISEDRAKTLLMVAFAGDVVRQVRIPELKEYLDTLIAKKLGTAEL